MLRCLTTKGTSGRGIMGTPYVGLLASELPSGFALPGLLANDVLAGDPAACRYRQEIVTRPSAGVLSVEENGAFSFTGAPDGTYTGTTKVYKNGVPDTGSYSFAIGAAGNVVNLAVASCVQSNVSGTAAVTVTAGAKAVNLTVAACTQTAQSGTAAVTVLAANPTPLGVTVPSSRTAKFAGRSRVVVFTGSKPVSYAKGPLDELYIAGNFSKDLLESNTTISSVTYDSKGVTVLEAPVLQNGFPVVKLGALDLTAPRMYFTFRVTLANGEQVDGTIELTALDDRKTFPKDPDDKRFWALDFGADATLGGTTLSTVSAPVVAGVTSLMTPAVANNQATVKVGGLDLADGAVNSLGLWANYANGERIYRTIYFAQEDH